VVEGKLVCEHCGYSEEPHSNHLGRAAEGFEFDVQTLERSEKGWGEERKELACQRCGGVVSTPPDIIAYPCPFCGSNKVLFREPLEDVLRPRYLIPFKVSPQTCQETVQKWLGNSWMLPSDLLDCSTPDKFHPVYIPYWVFTAVGDAVWVADVAHNTTEFYTRNGREATQTRTNWREEEGKVHKFFEGLLVPGTSHLNLATLGKVDYYKIEDLILYEPGYLAGMQAQAYNLPLDEAWRAGRQIMRERTRQACLDKASSTNMRNFKMTLDFSQEQWRYILAPIYTSVYHYQERTFQILINGQTGQVAGPRPVDWEKVWMVIAAILAPGLLLSLVGWYFSSDRSWSISSPVGIALLATGLVLAFSIIMKAKELERV
jgi:predicted  nucleic acid-binding Zn-ribbon protein